jgi:1-deoxy-D-xylulose-5-phosphate synthase
MDELAGYALLGRIDTPAELRRLPTAQLAPLAHELRRYLIETQARIGGHFAANLGVVELSLALHYVYDTPRDRLLWDVGHQSGPHKLLTGRRARWETLRQRDGLGPFCSREESEYDPFVSGHAGNALSAAAGMAAAVRLQRETRRVVAVIGDGGLTAGASFEALNHIGALGLDLLVICNDNGWSISENVGALHERAARSGSLAALFESFGFRYHGPADGHDLDSLIAQLQSLRQAAGPQLLHLRTVKGKGFAPAEADPLGFHGITRFDPVTGGLPAKSAGAPAYSQVFGEWLCAAAAHDERVVAITPAMREGSGLVEFARRFPKRFFDVGIAEQHAVTLAAGLAAEGLRPVCAIYSTFLQRGYDQLIHDVAIQKLPVLLAVDRGGLVGADGATHHGAFDLSYLRCVPNLVVMAPSDAQECRRMLAAGLAWDGPSAVRYPRGAAPSIEVPDEARPFEIGSARLLRRGGTRRRRRVALLAFGPMLQPALEAADILDASVADMRFVKPLDSGLIAQLATGYELLVTIEDNVVAGGAGSGVNEVLARLPSATPILNLGLPDRFVAHGTREELLAQCGLDAGGILRAVQKRLRQLEAEALKHRA